MKGIANDRTWPDCELLRRCNNCSEASFAGSSLLGRYRISRRRDLAYLALATGSIPLFLIASAQARNAINRLAPSTSPEPATPRQLCFPTKNQCRTILDLATISAHRRLKWGCSDNGSAAIRLIR
jgi:hypothetical protein